MKRAPRKKYADEWKKLTAVGAKGHDFEYLKHLIRKAKCRIDVAIAESFRRVATWSTDLRYEVGLIAIDDAERFLAAAKSIRDWCVRS